MFENYIRDFYHAACAAQHDLGHDFEMMEILAENIQKNDQTRQLVYSWMRAYGLFQGVTNENRWRVVDAFFEFSTNQRLAEINNKSQQPVVSLLTKNLHSALHFVVPKVWISATSKLLWCMYPNHIVIYDKFAERSINVLQSLTPQLRGMEPLGNRPKIVNGDEEPLLNFYMRYDTLVRALYDLHRGIFEEMRAENIEGNYPYDIRILDKLLWMLGDPNATLERNAV